MLSRDRLTEDARQIFEKHYLESLDDHKDAYARLTEGEKRKVLKAFLEKLTVSSDGNEWVNRLADTL